MCWRWGRNSRLSMSSPSAGKSGAILLAEVFTDVYQTSHHRLLPASTSSVRFYTQTARSPPVG